MGNCLNPAWMAASSRPCGFERRSAKGRSRASQQLVQYLLAGVPALLPLGKAIAREAKIVHFRRLQNSEKLVCGRRTVRRKPRSSPMPNDSTQFHPLALSPDGEKSSLATVGVATIASNKLAVKTGSFLERVPAPAQPGRDRAAAALAQGEGFQLAGRDVHFEWRLRPEWQETGPAANDRP